MVHPDHSTPEQYTLHTLEKVPTEDKLILSREEELLSPEEIVDIVRECMEELPPGLQDECGPEVFDFGSWVACEVLNRIRP